MSGQFNWGMTKPKQKTETKTEKSKHLAGKIVVMSNNNTQSTLLSGKINHI